MKETELKIRIYGDKILLKKSLPVEEVGANERELLEKMVELMYAARGVGLAAPQVGVSKQMIVVDVGEGVFKLVNPKIKKKEDCDEMEEGCLSLPGVNIKIKRAKRVFIEARNEFDKQMAFWAEGLFARALQHEVDHLEGKLIIDYAGFLKKKEIVKKIIK